eukprot:SAG31_NODE_12144_length_964_cov_1.493642_2_plen_144_part_01
MQINYMCMSTDWDWIFDAALAVRGGVHVHVRRAAALPSQQQLKRTSARRPSLLRAEAAHLAAWGTSAVFDELNSKVGLCQALARGGALARRVAPPTICVPWDAGDSIDQRLTQLPSFAEKDCGGGEGDGWLLLKPARGCHGDGI